MEVGWPNWAVHGLAGTDLGPTGGHSGLAQAAPARDGPGKTGKSETALGKAGAGPGRAVADGQGRARIGKGRQ